MRLDLEADGPLPARFDAKLLQRALRNILDNALRAAAAGGGHVVVRVGRDDLNGGAARIAVLDDGPGVRPENLLRIFDPYFSTHDTGTGWGCRSPGGWSRSTVARSPPGTGRKGGWKWRSRCLPCLTPLLKHDVLNVLEKSFLEVYVDQKGSHPGLLAARAGHRSRGVSVLILILLSFGVPPAVAQERVGGAFVEEGPGELRGGQAEGMTNNPVVGAVETAAAHPTSNALWIGAVNGGIWRTADATAASPVWVNQTPTLGSLSIGAVEIDPTDATVGTLVAASIEGARSAASAAAGPACCGRPTEGQIGP